MRTAIIAEKPATIRTAIDEPFVNRLAHHQPTVGEALRGDTDLMTAPRNHVVDPETPGVHHGISRCVRRAFPCGKDEASGRGDAGPVRAGPHSRNLCGPAAEETARPTVAEAPGCAAPG